MSAIEAKQQPLDSGRFDSARPSPGSSPAAKLIELSVALARAESHASVEGLCSQCWAPRDPLSSTAQCANVFCSEQCEREFIQAALSSITLDDCIRMQHRLETLLTGAEAADQ